MNQRELPAGVSAPRTVQEAEEQRAKLLARARAALGEPQGAAGQARTAAQREPAAARGTAANHNLQIALKWAAAGAAVFPVKIIISEAKIDKVPRLKWRAQSTTNPETIKGWWKRWPDSVPGIDLAKAGLVVLDGDRHGGPDGVQGLDQLFKDHNLDVSAIPVVITPQNGGRHAWFKQPADGEPLGNRDKAVKDSGINVRGSGGFVVAPGALLSDGRRNQRCDDTPSTIEALIHGTIPVLPPTLAAVLRAEPNGHDKEAVPQPKSGRNSHSGSVREQTYALATLHSLANEVATTTKGGRNIALNNAAMRMGHMVASGWIARHTVEQRLLGAAHVCGLVDDDGLHSVEATIKSGLDAGEGEPAAPLEGRDAPKGAKPAPHPADPSEYERQPLIKSSKEFVAEFVPPDYLVDGLLQEGFLYSLTGATGAGKTAITLRLAASIGLGAGFANRETKKKTCALPRRRKSRRYPDALDRSGAANGF
jgi:hypothetical protein